MIDGGVGIIIMLSAVFVAIATALVTVTLQMSIVYYIVTAVLAGVLMVVTISKAIQGHTTQEGMVDKVLIVMVICWYAVYWGGRSAFGLNDATIGLSEYCIAMMPLALALAAYIANRIRSMRNYRTVLLIVVSLAVVVYSSVFDSTANEVILVLAIWLTGLASYQKTEFFELRMLMGWLIWYQAIFSVSAWLPSPIWDTYWLQVIGMTPFVGALAYAGLLQVYGGRVYKQEKGMVTHA